MPEFHWISESISTVTEFLSPEECAQYIELAEQAGFDPAPINTSFGAELRPDVRNNSRVLIDDVALAATLWTRLKDYVTFFPHDWSAIGLNERFRLYRYDAGQQFDWHLDGSFDRSSRERSFATFMVYLNDDFEGGATAFHDTLIQPELGKALLFMHRQWHKGEPVSAGRKYVLRSDVMYRMKH